MTSNEFVLWLKGFTEGVHEFNITPKQWDLLKEKLAEVEDKVLVLESPKFPFGVPNTTPNINPFPNWQQPHYVDPYNPYKVTCTPGTTSPGFQVTTTPGTTGFITIANPNIASFGDLSTSTSTSLPSGSTISYTNKKEKIF
jgi:hypothetical protein